MLIFFLLKSMNFRTVRVLELNIGRFYSHVVHLPRTSNLTTSNYAEMRKKLFCFDTGHKLTNVILTVETTLTISFTIANQFLNGTNT